MKFDYEIQKQMMICMIAAIVILSGVVIWQSIGIQTLMSQSGDLLNNMVPFDINLIQHMDCSELKDWNNILNLDNGPQTPTNQILSNTVNKELRDKLC